MNHRRFEDVTLRIRQESQQHPVSTSTTTEPTGRITRLSPPVSITATIRRHDANMHAINYPKYQPTLAAKATRAGAARALPTTHLYHSRSHNRFPKKRFSCTEGPDCPCPSLAACACAALSWIIFFLEMGQHAVAPWLGWPAAGLARLGRGIGRFITPCS